MTYKTNDLEVDDYVKVRACDDWFKITGFTKISTGTIYIECCNNWGSVMDCMAIDIEDVLLESEMPFGENF